MEKIIVKRDGLPPISFTGEKIASGNNRSCQGSNQNRWTEAHIYRTKGGKYVARISRLSQWANEGDSHAAASFATAEEVIDWLKEGESELGSVSQEAVEKAVKVDPNFAGAWVEEVE